jgi:predicted aspartyl protease
MRLAALHVAALAALLALLAGRANAQVTDGVTTDPGQLMQRWQAANATCRSQTSTALAAVGACEQRDTLSKLLSQMNYCYGPADKAGPLTWTVCGGNQGAGLPGARTTAQFHRMGGVFVLPAVINGGTKSYFIVDSGAANVQIPEEIADEMKRSGTLADSDFLGQRRFTLADGSGLQQRVFRLKSLQIGDRTMENVLAAVGAPRSRPLLGQSSCVD